MKRLSCFVVIGFLAVSSALAQTASYTASHLAVAREVIILSGLTKSFDIMLPEFAEQLRRQMVTRPEAVKDLEEVLKSLEPEMELQKQTLINATARIFASRMTETELKDTATFFKSTSGAKYSQAQPQIFDETSREIQKWTGEVAEYVIVRARAEMAKRGHSM